MDSAKFTAPFIKKEQLTYDVHTFYFKKPGNFTYTAGQYNRWTLPIENPDERGNSRYFTISSAPSDREFLTITTKISDSSFKKTLANLNVDDEIEIFGPLGKFTLDEPGLHHVFIAGGIGITPYHSMVREASLTGWNGPITLFASYSTTEDIVFHDEFTETARSKDWFKYLPTVTRPEESKQPWTGLTGRLNKDMLASNLPDLDRCIFYLCGPPAMVDALRATAGETGIPPEKIKSEKFTGY